MEVSHKDRGRSSCGSGSSVTARAGHSRPVLTLLFPGQGSQVSGLLTPWLCTPGAAESLARWSDLAQVDLVDAGTSWSAERLLDTAVAQPLLAAAALLSARALLSDGVPDAVCGHSIGELPALAVAGVLTEDEAVALAAVRGRAMAAAARTEATGLLAVLGGDPDEIRTRASTLGLSVATVNVDGQVVLGGAAEALDLLAAAPPAGARLRRLAVAAAFHTAAMQAARPALAEAVGALPSRRPRCAVVANRDGVVVTSGREALDRLVEQLTGPVRFDLCLQTLSAMGVTGAVELAPGGTLTALAKRALPHASAVALRTPDDLVKARGLLGSAGEAVTVDWQALPCHSSGVIDLTAELGHEVTAGESLAVVTGREGPSAVSAPRAGVLAEWLVCSGDPVRTGQLLAVLS